MNKKEDRCPLSNTDKSNTDKSPQARDNISHSADTTGIHIASMLGDVTETILLPTNTQVHILENNIGGTNATCSTSESTSSKKSSRAGSNNCKVSENMGGTAMKGKKSQESLMEEVDNIRRWFSNGLKSGDERACAVAINDSAFISLYLSLAKKNFLSQQISTDCTTNASVPNEEAASSIFAIDRKILHAKYSKSELACMYESHRINISGDKSKTTKSLKSANSATMRGRKKQSKSSLGDTASTIVNQSVSLKQKQVSEEISEEEALTKAPITTVPETVESVSCPEIFSSCVDSSNSYDNSRTGTMESNKIEDYAVMITSDVASDDLLHKLEEGDAVEVVSSDIKTTKLERSGSSTAISVVPGTSFIPTEEKSDSLSKASFGPKKTSAKSVCENSKKRSGKDKNTDKESTSISADALQTINMLAELHSHIRLVVSSPQSKGSTKSFDLLLLDTCFLENGTRFIQLADNLIRNNSRRREGFLSVPPLKRSRDAVRADSIKMNHFPSWLKGSNDYVKSNSNHRRDLEDEVSKSIVVPFHLLLLARLEMAIWGAYYRYLNFVKQTQGKSNKIDCGAPALSKLENNISSTSQSAFDGIFSNIKSVLCNEIESVPLSISAATKLHALGKKIGFERRQKLLYPIFSLLKRSGVHLLMQRGDDAEIEISIVDDCLLENILLVPWAWVMRLKQQKINDENDDRDDILLIHMLLEVYEELQTSFTGDLKDDLLVFPVKDVVPILDDAVAFGTFHEELVNDANKVLSKNKKKKKKKKKRKNSTGILSISPESNAGTTSKSCYSAKTEEESHQHPTSSNVDLSDNMKEGNTTEAPNAKSQKNNGAAITLQRVDGGTTCVVVERPNETHAPSDDSSTIHNDSQWERVESKYRGSRSKYLGKPSSAANSVSANASQEESANLSTGKGNKNKSGKTSTSRRRIANRKIVRELLFNVIDDVCEQVENKKKEEPKKPNVNSLTSPKPLPSTTPQSHQPKHQLGVSSLRDIVVANLNSSLKDTSEGKKFLSKIKEKSSSKSVTNAYDPDTKKGLLLKSNPLDLKNLEISKNQPMQVRGRRAALVGPKLIEVGADQNTAPTVPETLSGGSGANIIENDMVNESNDECADSENNSSDEINTKKRVSGNPLLVTLLPGLDHVNSATSSVASSLENPLAPCSQDARRAEKDVGYHLLIVCERLSNDTAKFMSRRALALSARRRERGALLSSLQDTAVKLWSGNSHVEMYGSCATQLDLPSSDLDVVIRGLPWGKPQRKHRKHSENENYLESVTLDANAKVNHHSINSGRIIRLAAELERQPWAVQVKAIPTASVPVVKMLADASRVSPRCTSAGTSSELNNDWVPNASGKSEWIIPNGQGLPSTSASSTAEGTNLFNFVPQGPMMNPYPPPWRGADVMNGLFKVDITFEGPEHGGIGSTAFAARVIRDACNETGLPPEATPVVQLTMVLKELLAQRRLNEPFSGGLSSYALLLMVVAIVRERKAIKTEMEFAESQRRAVVSSSATNQRISAKSKQNSAESVNVNSQQKILSSSASFKTPRKNNIDPEGSVTGNSQSSTWATVARKGKTSRVKDNSKSSSVSYSKPLPSYNDLKTPPAELESDEGLKETSQSNISNPNTMANSSVSVGTQPNSPKAYAGDSKHSSIFTSMGVAHSSFGVSHGSNDVLEVLCSGEPTAGKLLMHFLLFYGKLFDSMTMTIDVTSANNGKGPFVARQSGGTIDPYTGMLTVDPIVVFDPLEGAEGNNVARSCFAWQNIKWVFNQCFHTLIHTMERRGRNNVGVEDNAEISPLLELILSY